MPAAPGGIASVSVSWGMVPALTTVNGYSGEGSDSPDCPTNVYWRKYAPTARLPPNVAGRLMTAAAVGLLLGSAMTGNVVLRVGTGRVGTVGVAWPRL